MSSQTYIVNGMTCQHCVANVQDKLAQVAGVHSVTVQLMPPRAVVAGENISNDALAHALEGTKFTITPMNQASTQ